MKMSKFVVIALLASMCLALLGNSASAAQFPLSFTTHDPITSQQTRLQQKWADSIKEKSGGRIEITIFPSGSLASAVDALDAVKTGAADMGWLYTSFFPGQFPIVDAITLPLLGVETAPQGTYALWDMYEYSEALRNDLAANGLKMLMLYNNPSNLIGTHSKPVYTVDDMKGLKLRAPAGTATEMVKAWGGVPIMMGPGDVYQSLEKGVLDGYVFEYTGIESFKLPEVTKHYTEVRFYVGPFLVMMNQSKFDSLPEDLRKIIEEESGKATSLELSAAFETDYRASREKIIAGGGNVIAITGDSLAAFQKEPDIYAQKWVEERKTAAFDAQDYLTKLKEAIKKYEGK